MKHLKEFSNTTDYILEEYYLVKPNVYLINDNNKVDYIEGFEHDYSKDYLTFIALESGEFCFQKNNYESQSEHITIQCSVDNGEWVSITEEDSLDILQGQTIRVKGNIAENDAIYFMDSITFMFNLEGNIMSLFYGDNFVNQKTMEYTVRWMFEDSLCYSSENLVLPATTLCDECYRGMFHSCEIMIKALKLLPAKIVGEECYRAMFYYCTALTRAPKIDAKEFVDWGSCEAMFEECSSLEVPPVLSAVKLSDGCYEEMFGNCVSLQYAPKLPATILADECYNWMFTGCESLTEPPVLPATTLTDYCYTGMFSYCSSLLHAPALPATTLTVSCYENMFEMCESLLESPVLPATTLDYDCYMRMFNGTEVIPDCSNIDFTSESVVQSGGLRGLFYGTVVTDEILETILPINNDGKYCLPVTDFGDMWYSGYQEMFRDCDLLETAPVLPALNPATKNYRYMFCGCKILNNIEVWAETITKDDTIFAFLEYGSYNSISSTGTFIINTNANYNMSDWNIPNTWTVQTKQINN